MSENNALINEQPAIYQPSVARLLGIEGALIVQLIHSERDQHGETELSYAVMAERTGLTADEARQACIRLQNYGHISRRRSDVTGALVWDLHLPVA